MAAVSRRSLALLALLAALAAALGGPAARSETPEDELAAARRQMVERIRARGVTDLAVLAAVEAVPRHLFVDPGLATQAYEDTSLPIGHGQTISKPSVVARMLELLFGSERAGAAGDLGAILVIFKDRGQSFP